MKRFAISAIFESRSRQYSTEMNKLLIILIFTCSQFVFGQNEDSILLVLESINIGELKLVEEHKTFLINVNDADQGIRGTVMRVEEEFGYGSGQHDSIFKKWLEVDRYLFNAIVLYLEYHPHPSGEMDKKACSTPNLVFHHVPGNERELELKKKYFPVFYNAYKTEIISSGMIWMYLYRLHEQLTEVTYEDYELGEIDQIEDMINLLGLKRK